MRQTRLHSIATRFKPWNGLVVLNYHRLGDAKSSSLDRGVFSGTAESFARQIDLVRQHAELIDPRDVPQVLDPSTPRGRYALITFDDGYRDNYELAFPVLQAKGAKASFFVSSGFLDNPRLPWNDEISWMVRSSTWPRISANRWLPRDFDLIPDAIDGSIAQINALYVNLHGDAESTRAFLDDLAEATGSGRAPADASRGLWMTWEMIREMHAAGMEIGGHTVDHPCLADQSPDDQEAEIRGVRDRLIAETGEAPTSFAYPYGGAHQFTETTKSLLAQHEYTRGYSFYGGYNAPGKTDTFDMRRVYVAHDTTDTAIEGLVSLPQLYGLVPPRLPGKR
jgi:peptidoglycan/xylan/chitin deacetylase (PgdA/CDA1 family)